MYVYVVMDQDTEKRKIMETLTCQSFRGARKCRQFDGDLAIEHVRKAKITFFAFRALRIHG